MKRYGWGIATFIICLIFTLPVRAIDTVPTTPSKISAPLLITGYSFSGPNLRYVQIYNNSSNLVYLDGWQIASSTKTTPFATTSYVTLAGMLEPGKHVFAALSGIIDRPSFILPTSDTISTQLVGAVMLLAPLQSGFNDESQTVPTITTATPKEVVGSQTNYYTKRDTSATTGNYLSGTSFILPTEKLKNDQLYVAPSLPLLQINEIYPDAATCAPTAVELTCSDYVKMVNASTSPIELSSLRLRTGHYGQLATSSNTRVLSGVVSAGNYITFPLTLSSSGSWVWLEDIYGTVRYDVSIVGYPSSSGYDGQAWSYDDTIGNWRWTTTASPGNVPNRFPAAPKINNCTGLRINEIAANVATEDQFIELLNESNQSIDITGCALQTNRSSTTRYVFGQTVLAADEMITVYIKDTGLTLTKTTSGSVYLLSSDMNTEADIVTYADLAESSSYALIDTRWRLTYQLTPNNLNIHLEYPACATGSVRNVQTGLCNRIQSVAVTLEECGEGKIRNIETNRCRSIETLTSGSVPCAADQYRNPDTNRCRSLVSTASVLAPCSDNQERNPATNRCRSISSASGLQPCSVNQERNPETNRCRNKSSNLAADFPVEAVAQSSEATIGWWAFGGVGTLAAGYAGWEWRREVMSLIKKITSFSIGRS